MSEGEAVNEHRLAYGLRYVEHTEGDESRRKYLATPIGYILPGTVKVEEIILAEGSREPRWTVSLSSPVGNPAGIALLEVSLKFVTPDVHLIRQLRHRKLRFALDLLQLEATEEAGGMIEVGVGKR